MKRIVVGLGAGFALVLWITRFDGGLTILTAAVLGGLVGALIQHLTSTELIIAESRE